MSFDKPAGGDGSPDRYSGREDRPFPGAPEDRGPAPELPKNTLSMEEVRAVHRRSGSNAEFEAAAEAHAKAQARAAGSSDSPDSGSTGEGPTTAVGEGTAPSTRPGVQDEDAAGTAVPGTDVPERQQPEGFARPEGFTRPDRELPPFPGAPEDRGPAPELPANTISMEEVRALHQRAGSNAEFEAMAGEYAAARKDASAARLDGGDLQDQDTAEPGERADAERAGPGIRTSMDTSPQPERGEEPSGEKDSEGQGEDVQGQKPTDLVQVRYPAPDAETDRPAEAAPETAPDQQPDDPRLAAMEQKMDRMLAAFETMQAKLDASEERQNELTQEIGGLRAENKELREEVAELRTEAGLTGWQERPDAAPDTGDQPEPDGIPDVTEQERLGLRGTDDTAADDNEQADLSDIDGRGDTRPVREEKADAEKTDHPGYSKETVEFWKSVAGVAGAAGFSVPGMDLVTGGNATRQALEKMSPEEQISAMRMGEAVGNAFGSMSPGTALAALGVSVVAPAMGGKLLDALHKIRRKD